MSPLEQSTGFLVVRTARAMKKALDARLAEFGSTASQQSVLSALAQSDGMSLSEIGKRVFLDNPAITGLADRLEQDGLVERRRSSEDRRVIKLYLTKKGGDLLRKMDDIAVTVDRELVNVLSDEELRAFREINERIWRNADGRHRNG